MSEAAPDATAESGTSEAVQNGTLVGAENGSSENGDVMPLETASYDETLGDETFYDDVQENPDIQEETEREEARETKDEKETKEAKDENEAKDEKEDENEDEDEEEEPPILKYTRLNKLPPSFFKKDPVSTASFGESVFVFGTHSGFIHLCRPDFSPIRTFKAHRASILSLYTDGTYFASGSMDGTIVIGSILDEKDIVMFDYKRPIHAVVLDKSYQRSRSFVYGGMSGKVVYSSKNWLDQRVELVLDQDNGPIVAILNIDDLLLWMNDKGITVYHTSTKQVISVIPRPSDSFRSDLYWPRVSFPETDRVLIAWGNYIWSLRASIKGPLNNAGAGSSVKSRILPGAASLSFRSTQEKKIEVEHAFKVDYLISGIASFKDDLWIVLAYNLPEKDEATGRFVPQNPDIKLLSSLDGSTEHDEEIGFNITENLGLNDYSLGTHIGPTSNFYYIISARDGVIAELVQLDDRLQWYLDRKMFLKAWTMSQHIVTPVKRLSFGVWHVESLVKEENWHEATEWLAKLLFLNSDEFPTGDTKSTIGTKTSTTLQADGRDAYVKEVASQWAHWSAICIKSGHVAELTAIVPTDPRWNLPKSIYSQILQFWLEAAPERAFELLGQWELDLYDAKVVTRNMEELLELDPDNASLRRQLCTLYERLFEPTKAVPHLAKLRDTKIVPFLAAHHILPAFVSDIPSFARLRFENESDIERLPVNKLESRLRDITQSLVDSRHEIPTSTILKLMFEHHLDILNYFYLEELAKIDELLIKGFGNERILLYSQYNRPKLLPFLTSHNNYDISRAIETCEMNALVDELVYLLGKTGENKKALKLIMEELDDPERAIRFAKRQNDQETWTILLEHSFSRPAFIKALLELADDQSSNFYNPITILQRMNTTVKIEGLKESVTKVSNDNDLNLIVNQLILKTVYKRSEEVSQTFYLDKIRGIEVEAKDPKLKALFDEYATVIVYYDDASKAKIELGPSADAFAKKLFTTMKMKLEHLKVLNENFKNGVVH